MLNKITIIVLFAINILNIPIVFSDEVPTPSIKSEEAILEEIRWLQAEAIVTIATKHGIPISKAPSMVTVITAEEIKHFGYRTFVEILRVVPGFEILKDSAFGHSAPAVRGVGGSERIRVLVDGHHVNNPLNSAAFLIFDDFPVENIKRIEIIRGPGSAVYGENALTAVINIITYDADDIDGVRFSSGFGRYDTHEENVVFGKTFGEFGISGLYRYRETNGLNSTVNSDSQTALDSTLSGFFPPASRAPGEVDDDRREYDLNLKLSYKDFYAEGLYINKNNGPFVGLGGALNDSSEIESNYVFVETGFKKTFDDRFTFYPRAYYDQTDSINSIELLPKGTTLAPGSTSTGKPDAFQTYPNGFFGKAQVSEKVVGAEIPLDYELFDGNTLTIGTEFRLIQQTNERNDSIINPISLIPLSSVQAFPWIREVTRRIWSFYIQDEWDITDTLNITLGGRFDAVTKFSGEISPRAGLSWKFMENASFRLLYGKSFRPPSFLDMFSINNAVIVGNENLDPEVLKSYEVGLTYQFNKYITSNINYFYNDVRDLIARPTIPGTITARYDNVKDAHIQGIEAETRIDIGEKVNAFMNYAFLDAQDNKGHNMPSIAKHKGNFGVNVQYPKYINTNLSGFVSAKRYRDTGDARDDMPAYALFNLSVIGKEFFKTLEIQGTVFNLLDKEYEDPGSTSIPDDLPRPGRTFFLGFRYQF
jgi:iron complex outermembrane receptor protein